MTSFDINKSYNNQIGQQQNICQVPNAEKTFKIKNKAPAAEKHNTAITVLSELHKDAQTSFDKQVSLSGWIGKTTDFAADVLGSNYCKKEIQDDIYKNESDIEVLKQADKEGNFNAKFFEVFGVNYDEKSVKSFKEVYDKNVDIKIAKKTAKDNQNALNRYVNFFTKNGDLDKIERGGEEAQNNLPNMDKQLDKFEKNLAAILGGKEILNAISVEKNLSGSLSKDEKIELYKDIAHNIMAHDDNKVKELTGGKSDKELKKEYNKAYKEAFGSKNNINKKVSEYAMAQKARKYMLKVYSLKYGVKGIVAMAGPLKPVTKAAIRSAAKFAMDSADVITREQDNNLDKKKVKNLAKNSALSGLNYLSVVKLYKAVPKVEADNDIVDYSLNEARKFSIRWASGKVRDKIKKIIK